LDALLVFCFDVRVRVQKQPAGFNVSVVDAAVQRSPLPGKRRGARKLKFHGGELDVLRVDVCLGAQKQAAGVAVAVEGRVVQRGALPASRQEKGQVEQAKAAQYMLSLAATCALESSSSWQTSAQPISAE
jgi:hypothetical protein